MRRCKSEFFLSFALIHIRCMLWHCDTISLCRTALHYHRYEKFGVLISRSVGKVEKYPQKWWMRFNRLWNFYTKLRFLIFVTRRDLGNEDHETNPKIESWEIQKSKLSHELLGDEPFETSILRFLKLKKCSPDSRPLITFQLKGYATPQGGEHCLQK